MASHYSSGKVVIYEKTKPVSTKQDLFNDDIYGTISLHYTILATQNMGFSLFILVATIATAVAFPMNHLAMPHGRLTDSSACLSWRWAVETNNIKYYSNEIPDNCSDYILSYMLGSQFRKDSKLVCDVAYEYAKGVNLTGDGMDVWIFDVDDTILSCVPYFLEQGSWELNIQSTLGEWTRRGEAQAIPETLNLYKKVIELGFKIVFITGMHEQESESRIKNLKEAGFTEWEKLIFKGNNELAYAEEFKSNRRRELVEAGYRIWGNIGDQWTDLTGTHVGDRTFKMPNPMYYVP
ncbi:hypothetical protein L1987_43678 [Smallanthus sonchifolius]|uniref:Uncharacterized protein n=1 Tax=Smallanthus sonchifolius TaxID=185202 RepID=A0ACB9GMG0_9ASTR|nr:hypothetical protein L1987_43678 [Smallanthus sonchifolius]